MNASIKIFCECIKIKRPRGFDDHPNDSFTF